jgi:hypothetical protein
MKSKKTPAVDGKGAQTGMDGMDGLDGLDGMDGAGDARQASLQMKSGIMASGADPNDRRMPGVTRRGQQQEEMPQAAMDAGQGAAAGAMPDGGMPARTGDGGGGGGMGGRRADDPGNDGGSPRVRSCGTMDVHRRLLSSDPAYARVRNQIEDDARRYEMGVAAAQRTGVTRIPVVVHVVWNTPAKNISDAQVASQIAVLNRDFRRTNPDFDTTPAAYLPLATDAAIEFYLTTSTPGGAPSNGIERRQTTVASFDSNDAVKSTASGGMDAWPSANYLNLWVCQLGGDLFGYAQFPGGPAGTDGVVILQSAFGTNGTTAAPFNLGRTATHEIGHWFNLNPAKLGC